MKVSTLFVNGATMMLGLFAPTWVDTLSIDSGYLMGSRDEVLNAQTALNGQEVVAFDHDFQILGCLAHIPCVIFNHCRADIFRYL